MSSEEPKEQQLPVYDEADQLRKFQNRLASAKIDRRHALQIFAAAGGAAALAACSSSNNNNTKATTAPTAASATKAPAASAAAPPSASAAAGSPRPATAGAGSPAAGSPVAAAKPSLTPAAPPAGTKLASDQTFKWNIESEPDSHDFNANLYCGGESELFAGLLQFSPDLEPIADIAQSWKVNDGGDVFTFTLRKDSKWSDGQPVTAKDFDYSFRRQLNPATKAPYASFLYDIKNAQAYNTGKVPDDKTLGLKIVDDYTLEVTCEAPAAYLPALLAYAAAYPAYKAAVDKFGDKWTEAGNIVSNGPYKLTKWDHNQSFELAKNDGYWNAKNITLTKVVRPVIKADAAQKAYENGEIDWVQRVDPAEYKRIDGDGTLKNEKVDYFLDGTWYLVPEADKDPFTDVKVRLAIAHAVDRDTIIKTVLQGLGQPAYTFIPPGTPGYNPNKYDQYTKFDPAAAKAALAGTKYEGGKNWPKITLTQRTEGPAEAAAGDAIIQMLGDNLGMKVDHEIGTRQDVYDRMWGRKLQLIWIRWYEDYPDPNDEQNLVFDSTGGGSTGHRQAWHDDGFDKLVRDAAKERDVTKRLALYQQADAILAQQAGAIFVYYPQNRGLLKTKIKNMPKDRTGAATPTWNIFVRMYDFMYVAG